MRPQNHPAHRRVRGSCFEFPHGPRTRVNRRVCWVTVGQCPALRGGSRAPWTVSSRHFRPSRGLERQPPTFAAPVLSRRTGPACLQPSFLSRHRSVVRCRAVDSPHRPCQCIDTALHHARGHQGPATDQRRAVTSGHGRSVTCWGDSQRTARKVAGLGSASALRRSSQSLRSF